MNVSPFFGGAISGSMRRSLLIYAIPVALVFVLGPSVVPIAFWLTVIIFLTRCGMWLVQRREESHGGFDIVPSHTAAPAAAEEPNAAADRGGG